jgi:predicted mannosyl-3-phosphoglycerate phosphatase (HAD superfamily)
VLRQAHPVVFLAIDSFLTARGKPLFEVDAFLVELNERGIPCVWVSNRSRSELDEPRRKLGHDAPFIAESGSGAYLPEDYFHLRPPKTLRLGRFTCIPVAEMQPAAREALEAIAEEAGVSVVTMNSLSPRELAQNMGLPQREAELCRMRDFSELFFFAGASEQKTSNFLRGAAEKGLSVHRHDAFWSLSVGGNEAHAIREISKLYDRALRARATRMGVGAAPEIARISPACDRVVGLGHVPEATADRPGQRPADKERWIPFAAPDIWQRVLSSLLFRTEPSQETK